MDVTPSCGCVMCDIKLQPVEKDGKMIHEFRDLPDIECTSGKPRDLSVTIAIPSDIKRAYFKD